MATNLRRLIRREIAAAHDNGAYAATNPVITTRAQLIDLGEERIVNAICEALTSPEVIAAGDRGCARPTNVRRVVDNVVEQAFGDTAN